MAKSKQKLTKEELETTQVLPYFKNCIEETDWFTKRTCLG